MRACLRWSGTALLLLVLLGACGGGDVFVPDPEPEPPPGPVPLEDVRLDTDPPGSELSLFPDICCDGERVYVVWYDRRSGNLDIHFNRFLDGGATWLAQDVRLDTDVAGSAGSLLPRICCSGLAVYVTWYDERDGDPDIRFNRSLDGGTTWLAQDVRLDTDVAGAAASREPVICCEGSHVFVAWYDDRGGSWDIRFNRSLDGGATWLAQDLRIDHDDTAARAELPRIACVGDTLHVAWRDDRDGSDNIYANRSLDAGATWGPTDARLSDDGPVGLPEIAATQAYVYVVWADARDGAADIRLRASQDLGATWTATERRLDDDAPGAATSSDPHLCAAGERVYVVWIDERRGGRDVFFDRSLDGGATWLAANLRLDDDGAGAWDALEPRICCDLGNLHVAWRDDRSGAYDIRLNHSPDDGATWRPTPVRLDADEAGAADSFGARVCCRGVRARVVWMDERDGSGDIYANIADFTPLLVQPTTTLR